jgi:Holliday junction DNA helicase RuvA
MIVRLTGTVLEVEAESVVIDRDGLSWEVLVPHYALGELAAQRGRQVTLHTLQFFEGNQNSGHLVPRLVGFAHPEDKRFFHRFIEVKGIGPRKALKALAEPTRRVAGYIRQSDAKMLARLPGIGKRAAEVIIATLKDKVEEFAVGGDLAAAGGGAEVAGQLTDMQRDALEVLVAWGDGRHDAEQWLARAAQLHPDIDTPADWVRAAYRIKTGAEK